MDFRNVIAHPKLGHAGTRSRMLDSFAIMLTAVGAAARVTPTISQRSAC
jgi:hypothetical protein